MIRPIAFYLPQFHTIPENDEWWGEGFTEWTNVRRGQPLFEGHYQPHVPLANDYYNLLDPVVFQKQIHLAKSYGIYGFCFYHYWFEGGKRLLEKPIEMYLESEVFDLPFCLCWANEAWSRAWDGGNKQIIMPQDYGSEEEWIAHFQYLLPFLSDRRYIRNGNGLPMLLIYRPELIDCLEPMMDLFQKLARDAGLGGISFVAQGSVYCNDPCNQFPGFDNFIMYEPGYTVETMRKGNIVNALLGKGNQTSCRFAREAFWIKVKSKMARKMAPASQHCMQRYSYRRVWDEILNRPIRGKAIPGAFTSWDNTARRGNRARIIQGTPTEFESNLTSLLERWDSKYDTCYLFITAWNEWGEGSHLEPDEQDKYGYLEGVRNALKANGQWPLDDTVLIAANESAGGGV